MKIQYHRIILIGFIALVGCNTPTTYINEAIDIIEKHSINKDSINWIEFRKDVLKNGEKAQTIEETYPAIRYALKKLGDNHSFLVTVKLQEKIYDKNNPLPFIKSEFIYDSIAYIKIPGFVGNKELANEFAEKLNSIVGELDTNYISGWIVDLRENTGGNMWPMLLGIGSIIEEDTVGYFVDTKSNYIEWIYKKGEVYFGKNRIMKITEPHKLVNTKRKKAILIGHKTASSGEAIVVSFKGSENTKFFGQKTAGVSTANKGFKLRDGAKLFLTVSKFADKNKKVYGNKIKPDNTVRNRVLENAIEWIRN